MIYTIGYGNRNFDKFLELLKNNKINCLIDIRTKPFSRFNPDFRKTKLEELLEANNIKYLFMGEQLGGMPDDQSCYVNGEINYHLVGKKDFFLSGLNELVALSQKEGHIVIMCAELDPNDCHRKNLVGVELEKLGIPVSHIAKDGSILNELAL